MKSVLVAFGRGVASQFNVRMLLLALLPLCAAAAAWGVLLWLGLQPTIDMVQRYFAEHDGFAVSGRWLSMFGLAAFKTVIVPLIAMWVFLPLMVVTALIFVGTMAMPAIVRHVGSRVYPGLERRRGGSFLGTLWLTMTSLLIFVALWIATTPLCAFPAVGFAIQPLLWGWLTCRVMAYDVFSGYADADEREALLRRHRWQLLAIGTVPACSALRRPCCGWAARYRSCYSRFSRCCRFVCTCWFSPFQACGLPTTVWLRCATIARAAPSRRRRATFEAAQAEISRNFRFRTSQIGALEGGLAMMTVFQIN